MAFLSRVGSILKQSVIKQVNSQISASSPSLYQAFRCMSSAKVFIGGLPYAVDDHSLQEKFSQYGQVVDAKVIVDREQNRSKGFGFVTFSSPEEASSAIQALDGQDFQGRTVRVNYANERPPRYNTGGYGGGSGGYGGGGYGGGGYGGGGYGGGGYGGQSYSGGGYGGGQNYGGGYGGSSGGYGGGAPAQQFGGGGGDFGTSGSHGVAAGVGDSFFGGGAAGGNVTAETGFGSSGFEDSPGLGGSEQFESSSPGAIGNDIGEFEPTGPLEETFKDDDDSDNFAKRA